MWFRRKKDNSRTRRNRKAKRKRDEVKFDPDDWYRGAGLMGLAPSELEVLTPYQFSLLREGFNERQKIETDRSKYIAYWVYKMAGKVVENPVSVEQFLNPNVASAAMDLEKFIKEKFTPEAMERYDRLFNPKKYAT